MIPYVPPIYFGYFQDRLLGQYHSLQPFIADLKLVYPDLLAQDDITIKNTLHNVVSIIKKRPQRVDSNPSNVWATIK